MNITRNTIAVLVGIALLGAGCATNTLLDEEKEIETDGTVKTQIEEKNLGITQEEMDDLKNSIEELKSEDVSQFTQ